MPMPRWLARINKRVFNPMEIRRGKRPVLIHTGRVSGETYRTPMDAHPVDGGYLFIPMYGPKTDWVRNVVAAGCARLRLEGREIDLTSPRLIPKRDSWPMLAPGTKVPPGIDEETPLLVMEAAKD